MRLKFTNTTPEFDRRVQAELTRNRQNEIPRLAEKLKLDAQRSGNPNAYLRGFSHALELFAEVVDDTTADGFVIKVLAGCLMESVSLARRDEL